MVKQSPVDKLNNIKQLRNFLLICKSKKLFLNNLIFFQNYNKFKFLTKFSISI